MKNLTEQPVGNGTKFRIYEACVKDVLAYKISPLQKTNAKGVARLQKKRVQCLRSVAVASLNLPESMFTVSSDGFIISGHHRQQAVREELACEASSLTGTESILLCVRDIKAAAVESQRATIDANNSASSTNIPKMMSSTTPLSEKIYKPLFSAMNAANSSRTLSEPQIQTLVCKLAEAIRIKMALPADSGQTDWAGDLVAGRVLDGITGRDMYSAKGGLAGKWATSECSTAPFSLAGGKEEIKAAVMPFFSLIEELHRDGVWESKIKRGTTLYYILLAISLRGELSQSLHKRIVKNFKEKGSEVKKYLKMEFLNHTAQAEDTIMGILNPK